MQNKIILKAYKNKNYIHKQIEQGILIFFNCDSSINRLTEPNQIKLNIIYLIWFHFLKQLKIESN
jgi:hypothetical protein